MALDLRVKNESDRPIAVMSFQISGPRGSQINEWNGVPVNANAGDERTIYYPSDGRLIDLWAGYTSVSVSLTKMRYTDGEIVDFDCNLGSSPVPPPFEPVKPTSPSPIYQIGGDVSPPRVLESHPMDMPSNLPRGQTIMTLSVLVEVDGSPHDIRVESGSLGEAVDRKAIETLSTWNFAPAMLGDKPVATRMNVRFAFGQ
jgi:TonB family protein